MESIYSWSFDTNKTGTIFPTAVQLFFFDPPLLFRFISNEINLLIVHYHNLNFFFPPIFFLFSAALILGQKVTSMLCSNLNLAISECQTVTKCSKNNHLHSLLLFFFFFLLCLSAEFVQSWVAGDKAECYLFHFTQRNIPGRRRQNQATFSNGNRQNGGRCPTDEKKKKERVNKNRL